MAEDRADPHATLTLQTKLEEEFVSPLTAVRGALEILRDFPDLSSADQRRFIDTALQECARLEKGVSELASSVYAAGKRALGDTAKVAPTDPHKEYAERIHVLTDAQTIEVDFSDFEFTNSKTVDEFYDVLDQLLEGTRRRWYIAVNYRDCSIWPEAWVAFAHRGKKVNVNYSLGTVRYVEAQSSSETRDDLTARDSYDPTMFTSRDLAFAHIDAMREAAK